MSFHSHLFHVWVDWDFILHAKILIHLMYFLYVFNRACCRDTFVWIDLYQLSLPDSSHTSGLSILHERIILRYYINDRLHHILSYASFPDVILYILYIGVSYHTSMTSNFHFINFTCSFKQLGHILIIITVWKSSNSKLRY